MSPENSPHLAVDISKKSCDHMTWRYDIIGSEKNLSSNPSIRRIQRVYTLTTVLFWLSIALPLPLSVLLIEARGMDLFQIGSLLGLYSLTIVLLEIPTGGLADAVGRKRIALLSYVFLLLSIIVSLFAFSYPAFLVAFILSGIGRALTSGTLEAWFIDSLQEAEPGIDLQPPLARIGMFAFLALGMGTLGGALIPDRFPSLPPDGSAVLTPLAVPIVFSIIPMVLLILSVIAFVHEARPSLGKENILAGFREVPSVLRQAFGLTRRNSVLLSLIGAGLVSGFVLSGLETFWQPQFADLLGGSEGNSHLFGVIMGGNFVVGMVGNQLAIPLSKRFGQRYGLLSAVFQGMRGVFLVLLALQTQALPGMLLFWLTYLNMGILTSPTQTLSNNEIPAENRSSMLSIGSLVSYLGSILGSAGLGYLAENASIGWAWGLSGAVLFLSSTLYWRVDQILAKRRSENDLKNAVLETR
jgi:DHA1 family quinolone resistance protein-like MFS transporter